MADQLPLITESRAVNATTKPISSLIGRGLSAIQNKETGIAMNDPYSRYRQAAEQGDRKAQWQLGVVYWDENDFEQAKYWLHKAALQGLPEAQYDLSRVLYGMDDEEGYGSWLEMAVENGYGPAICDYVEWFELEDEWRIELFEKAFAWYAEQAEQGNPEMQFDYARLHLEHAKGPNKIWIANSSEGYYWLRKAAEQDFPKACLRLGLELLRKVTVNEDTIQEAIQWLKQGAKLGDPYSCNTLGDLNLLGNIKGESGRIVKPNWQIAVFCYERGIKYGTSWDSYNLGRLYLIGKYLPQNIILAEQWLLHAAKAGNRSAQFLLGEEYITGERLKQNVDAGIHWLIEASQSTPKAALRLGEIYRRGEIVPKDVGKAVEWFTKATQFISSALKAKKTLGAMYASGELGAIDINISSKWYSEVVEICNKKLNEGLPNPSEYAYELAELYENGTEVRKDKERATNLYMQAANLKHSKAIKRLEELGINWKNS